MTADGDTAWGCGSGGEVAVAVIREVENYRKSGVTWRRCRLQRQATTGSNRTSRQPASFITTYEEVFTTMAGPVKGFFREASKPKYRLSCFVQSRTLRDAYKREMFAKHEVERRALRYIIANSQFTPRQKTEAQLQLTQLPALWVHVDVLMVM
ncbi:hypothetical protein ABW21_db0203379 [Orbilia brochopaga]|nr:hypothetical protein ABW21_db0203379 [Drechslerella brochopaga]